MSPTSSVSEAIARAIASAIERSPKRRDQWEATPQWRRRNLALEFLRLSADNTGSMGIAYAAILDPSLHWSAVDYHVKTLLSGRQLFVITKATLGYIEGSAGGVYSSVTYAPANDPYSSFVHDIKPGVGAVERLLRHFTFEELVGARVYLCKHPLTGEMVFDGAA